MKSNGIAYKPVERNWVGQLIDWWDRVALFAARSLILCAIVYASWRFGAVETATIRDLVVLLIAATGLVILSPSVWAGRTRLPVVLLASGLAFLVFAWSQSAPLPGFAEDLGFARPRYAQDQIRLLSNTVASLGRARSVAISSSYGSVVPEETRQAMVPFVLALMIALVSALVFTSPSSRKIYLWALVINASVLSAWGIIQRANGDQQILPGIDFEASGVPFASFVYKNAGAAALLPALAIIAALLLVRKTAGRHVHQYRVRSEFLSGTNLTLIGFGALITTGLVVSLSRGAWIAAVLAAVVVAGTHQLARSRRLSWGVIGSVALTIVSLIIVSGLQRQIFERAMRFSFDALSADQRWQHWPDGLKTAVAHLPFGSGLGTYGYATLPNHRATYGAWFQRAHNQYLETFAETGLLGVLVLGVTVLWFAILARRLTRQTHDIEKRQWGLIATAILVCGAVQSSFDFVLLIPAILLLYASLIGVIGGLTLEPVDPNFERDGSPNRRPLFGRMSLAAWCLFSVGTGLWVLQTTTNQLAGDRALVSTDLSLLDEVPSEQFVESQVSLLDDAIRQQPERAALYNRRAHWHFAGYRLSVIDAAERSGADVPWTNTQPELLFNALTLQSNEVQEALRTGLLTTDEMKHAVAETLVDLANSLVCNPLIPQTYIDCAYLSPLAEMPVQRWTRSAAPLVNNSHQMLFTNGVIACYTDDMQMAVDQWQRSLSINHKFIEPIYMLAEQRLSPVRVACELVPKRRPDMLLRLLRSAAAKDPESLPLAAEEIIRHLEAGSGEDETSGKEVGIRHATIAKIHQLTGRPQAAVESWQRAVTAEGRNLDFRWGYAGALRSSGLLDEALNQTALGQAIDIDDKRFDKLALQIRKEISHMHGPKTPIMGSLK